MSIGVGRIQVVTKIRIKGGTKVRTKVTFQTGQIIQRQEVGMEASSKARAEEMGQEGNKINKINKIKIGTRGTMPSSQKTLQLPSLRTKDVAS